MNARRCIAAAMVLAAGWPLASALPRAKDVWLEARTPHLELVGNAPEPVLRRLGQRLENLRHALKAAPGELDLVPRRPTRMLVFQDWSSARDYFPDELIGGRVGGTFLGVPESAAILVNASPELDPFALICHEYLHFVLRQNFSRLPLWLEEGLAEFYTTFWADSEQAELGAVNDEYLQQLRLEGALPLETLLAVTADSPLYQDAATKQRFHAQAWALVHYLMMGRPEQRLQLWARLERQRTRAVDPLTRELFDKPLDEVAADLAAYVETLDLPRYRVDSTAGLAPEDVVVNPLERQDAAALLGDLLVDRGAKLHPKARKHYRLALKLDPDHPRAHAGLGRLALAANDLSAASERFARAADLDPEAPEFPYLQARTLLRQTWGGRLPVPLSAPSDPDPRVGRARALLARAVRLAPELADPRIRLGYAMLFDRSGTARGIEQLETARRMLPGRLDAAYYLLIFYLRDGRRAEAEQIAGSVLGPAAGAAWSGRAQTALAWFDVAAAERLGREGRAGAGVALLREVLTRPLPDKVAANVRRKLAALQRAARGDREGSR